MKLAVLLAALACTGSLAAQPHPFDLVVDETQGHTGVRVDSVAYDTLFGTEHGQPLQIPVSRITQLYGPVRSSTWLGAAVGGLAGYLGGVIWATGDLGIVWLLDTWIDTNRFVLFEPRVLVPTLGGALIGGLIGTIIPHREVFDLRGATLEVKLGALQMLLSGKDRNTGPVYP